MEFVAPISNETLDNIIRDIDQGKTLRAINKMRLCIMDSGNQGQGEDRDPFSAHAYNPLRRWTDGKQYLIVPINQFIPVPGHPGMYTYTIQVPGYNPAAASIPGYARQNAVSAGSRAQPTSLMPGGSVAGGSIQRAGVATVRTGQRVQQPGTEPIPVAQAARPAPEAPVARTIQTAQRVEMKQPVQMGQPVGMGQPIPPLYTQRRGRKRNAPNTSCARCKLSKTKCVRSNGRRRACVRCANQGRRRDECWNETIAEAQRYLARKKARVGETRCPKRNEHNMQCTRDGAPHSGACTFYLA